jgi:hypothetical protein
VNAYCHEHGDLIPLAALAEVAPADQLKVASIAAAMQRGQKFDPVLIDNNRVVRDGKHRTAASRAPPIHPHRGAQGVIISYARIARTRVVAAPAPETPERCAARCPTKVADPATKSPSP